MKIKVALKRFHLKTVNYHVLLYFAGIDIFKSEFYILVSCYGICILRKESGNVKEE